MNDSTACDRSEFDPSRLLDTLIARLQLENDAALARVLAVAQPVIGKIRRRKLPIGGVMLIRIREVSNLSVSELRSLMGDRRNKCRMHRITKNSFLDRTQYHGSFDKS